MLTTQINEAITLLESEIQELKALMGEWDRLSVNLNGQRKYNRVARRIVIQSQGLERFIKASVFSRQ
jgi:hypothetical protein